MKHSRLFLLLTPLILFMCFGCAEKQMYYLGNYSQTLYSLEKNRDDDALLKHKQELKTIISQSEERNLPVPPGIYAELGYIELKENKPKEAIRLFRAESRLYPESKPFMTRLIQNAKLREQNSSDSN
ncbi:MAG: DUF4810 domain-containing protein [bacterium]